MTLASCLDRHGDEGRRVISSLDAKAYDRWISEIRGRSTPPPRSLLPSPRRGLNVAYHALLLVAFAGVGYGLTIWCFSERPATATVQGQLVDPAGYPIRAKVFLAADPSLVAWTDAKGSFQLNRVPLGRQSLVAVIDDLGQEYPFRAVSGYVVDLGYLTCVVPPLAVRRLPGGGITWPPPDERPAPNNIPGPPEPEASWTPLEDEEPIGETPAEERELVSPLDDE